VRLSFPSLRSSAIFHLARRTCGTYADSVSPRRRIFTGQNLDTLTSSASQFSLDDDRKSVLSLAGSAWTADSDDDIFYDAVEEQPLDDVARNVKIGNWVEGVLATPLLAPDVSDAEYAETARKVEERRARWAREDAAKAAKLVKAVDVAPEVVAAPPALEPLPVKVALEAVNYMALVQAELARQAELERQAAHAAIELYSTAARDEEVEMDVDPVPMDLDVPSSASSFLLLLNENDMDVDDVYMDVDFSAAIEDGGEDRMDLDEDFSMPSSPKKGAGAMDLYSVYPYSLGFSSTSAGATACKPAPRAAQLAKPLFHQAARAPLADQRAAFLGKTVISPLGVQLHVPHGMGSARLNLNAPGPSFDNKVAAKLSRRGRQADSMRRPRQ